jgi:hypothetical protein
VKYKEKQEKMAAAVGFAAAEFEAAIGGAAEFFIR